jgi:hypothetical protein
MVTRRQEGASTATKDNVVQSPEVSSSIDDTALTPSKVAGLKARESVGPPKGKIHRVSGSLFVQNQEPPPRPTSDLVGPPLMAAR